MQGSPAPASWSPSSPVPLTGPIESDPVATLNYAATSSDPVQAVLCTLPAPLGPVPAVLCRKSAVTVETVPDKAVLQPSVLDQAVPDPVVPEPVVPEPVVPEPGLALETVAIDTSPDTGSIPLLSDES